MGVAGGTRRLGAGAVQRAGLAAACCGAGPWLGGLLPLRALRADVTVPVGAALRGMGPGAASARRCRAPGGAGCEGGRRRGRLPRAAGGALDIIAAVCAMNDSKIPAAKNCERKADGCNLNIVNQPQEARIRYALCCSYTYGGQTAAVVLKKPD